MVFFTPTLRPIARLSIAGKDQPGSALLAAISGLLPGRIVVAFEVFGVFNRAGVGDPDPPGSVWASVGLNPGGLPDKELSRLNPWHKLAKRARDGIVIHLPILEQSQRKNWTCANPACQGHKFAGDSCPGW
jgi:hypothetical protein